MSLLKKLGFLSIFTIPALIVWGYYMGGVWTFSGFIFGYGIIPLLDTLIGKDPENITEESFDKVISNRYFYTVVYAQVYVHIAIVLFSAYVVSLQTMTTLEWTGLLLSVMLFMSSGINIAHELGHKRSKIAQFHSQLTLMLVGYMHFFIEHNKGHHVNVATPKDPATSKKNQTFYAFWVQSVLGGWRSAWGIESRRLERHGLRVWSRHNAMLWYIALPVAFCALLTTVLSWGSGHIIWAVPVFWVAQSILAFSSLEAVNYVEHYGIVRREIAPGKYERVNPLHSWNSNHRVSNFFLFQLQRHSDHHAHAARPYQVLRHFDESPQLPSGYPVMILMSLVPPLWFGIMNKRLEHWQGKAYNAEQIKKVVQATV